MIQRQLVENADSRSIMKSWKGLQGSSLQGCLPSSVTDQLKLSVDTVYMKPSSRSLGSGGCQAASWGMLQNCHGENRQLERAHLEPRANNLLLQFCGNRKAFSSQGSLQLPPKPKPKTALTALHYDNSQQFQQHQEARVSKLQGLWVG